MARHIDLTEIGIAVDRHVLAQTLGFGLLPNIQGPVNADAAINASIWLWRMACKEHSIDPLHCTKHSGFREECAVARSTA